MIDPAVIATIAASAASQGQPKGPPVTLGGLVFSFVVVFGIAGLLVWVVGAYTQMGICR